jgi:hypothetical protein
MVATPNFIPINLIASSTTIALVSSSVNVGFAVNNQGIDFVSAGVDFVNPQMM